MTYLYGSGGHAKVIIEILESNSISIGGLFDDNSKLLKIYEYAIGTYNKDTWSDKDELIFSIGNNATRKKLASLINVQYGKAVHPRSNISSRALIGAGTVIMAGATLNADAIIGKHCIINTNASIDHDCVLEDYVHISPNATLCGNVNVGEGAHIGAGAVVIPGINIGRWATIGAGSVIIRDVEEGVVVFGNPAGKKNVDYYRNILKNE